jgi:hypothetical protein
MKNVQRTTQITVVIERGPNLCLLGSPKPLAWERDHCGDQS